MRARCWPDVPRPVVFLGPSLAADEALAIADVELRPPARAGDVLRAIAGGATTIGLVDGLFGGAPSVRHGEILLALDQGVAVHGAASMGALRAAELDRCGMVGIGDIYMAYASGELVTDDAVALVHGPAEAGWRPLSVPLVDVLATLDAAAAERILERAEIALVTDHACRTFYPQRLWPELLKPLAPGRRARMLAWLPRGQRSVKARDARALLRSVIDADRPAPGRRVERTEALEQLIRASVPGIDPARFWQRRG